MLKPKNYVKYCVMRKIVLLLQHLSKYLICFFVCLIWTRYFFFQKWLAFLLAGIFTTLIFLCIWLYRRKKQAKTTLKLKEKQQAEDMFVSLAQQAKPLTFFAKLAQKKHPSIKQTANYLVINHTQQSVKTVLWFDSSLNGLDANKLFEIAKKTAKEKASKIVVCCREIKDSAVFVYADKMDQKWVFLDQYQTYQDLYKLYDFYPEITLSTTSTSKKLGLKELVAYSFNKKRTKGYLLSGFVLMISAMFARFSLYYCIMASLLFVFAIVSQFNGRFNQKQTPETL